MKIAFLHSEGKFNVEFLRELRAGLAQHELLTWIRGESAPAHDLDVLLSIGIVGREELANQPKLALIQTVSTGYENVDINTASELGIWVSYAPSAVTGNATSVAEFAVLLLLGASRHLGEALQSLHDNSVKPSPLSSALSGKTVCIVGMGSMVRSSLTVYALLACAWRRPTNIPSDYVVLCLRASEENKNLLNGTVIFISRVVEEFAAGKKPNSVLNSPQKPRRALRG